MNTLTVIKSLDTPKSKLIKKLGKGDVYAGYVLYDEKVTQLLKEVDNIYFNTKGKDYAELIKKVTDAGLYKSIGSARSSLDAMVGRTTTHSLRYDTYATLTKVVELYQKIKEN